MELVDGFKAWLNDQFGCPVIIEPQRQDRPEPRWRLAVGGFAPQGEKRQLLTINGAIQADGDGPVFLDKLATISKKAADLKLTEKGFEFEYTMPGGTYTAKASFTLQGDGGWQQNDEEEKFSFSWVEQYKIQLSYNPDNK